jgi:signal recognition particle subunit SEC65
MARAVKQPSAKEIWQAAMTLGYSPEITEKMALSKSPAEKTGYVTMKKRAQRPMIMKNIAGEIVKIRQKEAMTVEQKKR